MDDAALTRGAFNHAEMVAAQDAFLEAYKELGTVRAAAERVGIGYRTHARWLATDPDYEERWRTEAKEVVADKIEEEAMRRAVDGVDRPVYQGGTKVGTVREFSDTLMVLLLKALRPEKYRENVHHSGSVGLTLEAAMMRGHEQERRKLPAGEVIDGKATTDESADQPGSGDRKSVV